MPLMDRVGAQCRAEYEERVCLLGSDCLYNAIEDASHFSSHCDYYDSERAVCLGRISEAIGDAVAPKLRRAMQQCDPNLFLGYELQELRPELQRKVDRIICDFLRVAWRKRLEKWISKRCRAGDPWQLK
jgi:hypothetical protein